MRSCINLEKVLKSISWEWIPHWTCCVVIITCWLSAWSNATRIVLQFWSIYPLSHKRLVGPYKYVVLVKPRGHLKSVLQLTRGELVRSRVWWCVSAGLWHFNKAQRNCLVCIPVKLLIGLYKLIFFNIYWPITIVVQSIRAPECQLM